jgi:hypothetical protein
MPALHVLNGVVWLHRLDPAAPVEGIEGEFASVTRSAISQSIVTDQAEVPDAEQTTGPFRVLEVDGPIDHETSGVVAGVARPLAEAGISIFAISSFDACHVLVPADRVDEALDALLLSGWTVHS